MVKPLKAHFVNKGLEKLLNTCDKNKMNPEINKSPENKINYLLLEKDVWIFDLDNTLYPADADLFPQIDVLMGSYISNLLNVDLVEAKKIQKGFFVSHGTTLKGLMEVYDIDPQHFMNFVHDIDLSPIDKNEKLDEYLKNLPGQKLVFTNGSVDHADRVLNKLGIKNNFSGVFDISHSDYIPKPNPEAYDDFIDHFSIDPQKAVMVEDMARNLEPAYIRGMSTVWIKTGSGWGNLGYSSDFIDHEIGDLDSWLKNLLEKED
ncbi:MAG: pyrimidine 5'-nucleotidase [Sphingomonadales bacterium]